MDLSVVIPCYNEVENVGKLQQEFLPVLRELLRPGAGNPHEISSIEVVFVDDGSRDGTQERLKEIFKNQSIPGIRFRFEQHAANRGLGAALRTGFGVAQGEIIVTTDSDGTYAFAEIPRLLACLTPQVDLVTASPYHPLGQVVGVPGYRLLLSRGSSLLYQIMVSPRIYTYTALFRAYRRQVIAQVPFEADGFLAGTELLVKAMLSGFRAAEYPAALHRRVFGVSKAKLLRTIRAHLGFLWRVLLFRAGLASIPGLTKKRGGAEWVQPVQASYREERK